MKSEMLVRDWFLQHGWDAMLTKKTAPHDIVATKNGASLYVEVKRRKMQWGDYPTIFLDVDKVIRMQKEAKATEGKCVFVVIPNDMKPRFVMLSDTNTEKWGTNTVDVQTHRADAADRGDLKYDIPLEDFRPLELA